MALSGLDTSNPDSFPETLPDNPELRAFASRIKLHYSPDLKGMSARLRLTLSRGETVEESCDAGVPERDLAVQQERIERKFRSLVEPRLGALKAQAMLDLLNANDTASVRALLALARPRDAGK